MSSKSQSTGSTDNNQPTPTAHKSGMTRRDLLRRSAVGAATVGAVSTGAIQLDHGPVQNSQAIAPAVVAGGVGASAAVGWALREYEIVGSDSPAEGLTADALRNESYNTSRTRKSTNASTVIDNRNIGDGIEHNAWSDGKFAAIEQLNEQESQENVLNAAESAIAEYETTIKRNIYRTWNESIDEIETYENALIDHPDTGSIYSVPWSEGDFTDNEDNGHEFVTETITLPNGEDFDLRQVEHLTNDDSYATWSPRNYSPTPIQGTGVDPYIVVSNDGDSFNYLNYYDWDGIYSEINDAFQQVKDEIAVYVDKIYSDIQSGELDTADLLTPREQAELTAEDEDFPQALADLQALNVSLDLEREAEIYMNDVGATLYGQLGYTGDTTLEVGTIDPDETTEDEDGNEEDVYPGSIFFTYDVSQGEGEWDAYETGVDGGTVSLTSEPFEQTLYIVHTTAGETAEFTTDELDHDSDADEWTIDLSEQLDDSITEVDRIEYYADTDGTQYETIQLEESFEIIRFTDSDGNEYNESNFERSEPHTDDNYITQEEWEEQQERHEELIEQYEDAQGSGISIPGVEDVLDGEANGLIGIAVVGMVLVSAILSALNPLS